MDLLNRIERLIRANVNSWLTQKEDPEKVLEQVVLELQQQERKMRQAVAQVIATYKRTTRQSQQAKILAQQWHERAKQALVRGEENQAREALTERQSHLKTAQALSEQAQQQQEMSRKLKHDLRILEQKVSNAKSTKDMYILRARSASTSGKIRELIHEGNSHTSLNAFERMEDKVLFLEAKAEILGSLESNDSKLKLSAIEGESSNSQT